MKKVLVAAFALVSISASAQKETILVGGDFSIGKITTKTSPNDTKQNLFNFSPIIGYQFTNNWTAGIKANISSQKSTNSSNIESKSSNIGVGPFVRYTKNLSDIFSLYGQLQGSFGSSKANGSKTGTNSSVDLFPGVFVNVKNGFGLNFSFGGLNYESSKPTGGNKTTGIGLSFGQTYNIGITKNFSIKKK